MPHDRSTHCPCCGTRLLHAGGIGDYCPKKGCLVLDNAEWWSNEIPTDRQALETFRTTKFLQHGVKDAPAPDAPTAKPQASDEDSPRSP